MKKLFVAVVLLISVSLKAQQTAVTNSPKQLVKNFFDAFHAQDQDRLRSFATDKTKLTSVQRDSTGSTVLTTVDYSAFILSIAAIPETASFEEKIHEYRVEENGLLATVTTPYAFYFNGVLSHCGVNSFQLVKFRNDWKIVNLIDTRSKQDCN